MKIYHGSTFKVEEPNIGVLNFKTDFGKGFYTTSDIDQAKKWAIIKKRRTNSENAFINVYEYTINKNLEILNFEKANGKWLDFIYDNRRSNTLIHQYDVVKGPVANDNLFGTLKLFEDNEITKKETLKRLKTYKLSNQISFHTKDALNSTKFIDTMEVNDEKD